ncbi:SGNH/GDSL hydrolase family protein [Microbacterium sediminis]|uniref:Uncharacterized protein n=1 Tax=Microbacterium sediminis TaxID=904291 RepID=A0A1B9NGK8_9MICO|nr:SGNH/GDSL hydrolase family protein [Microbacterium sediminis]OCG75726.1 hypothetical protein A7J15_01350 [Microbacterium sediminis]QBR74120.1 SGNH/GDSL hydrolase family protein [Microbacterium sediminis]
MPVRRTVIAAAVAAVVLVGAAVAAVSLTRSAEPPGCDDIRAYQERYGEIETLGDGDQAIAVLGDSYAAGDELADRGDRWTDALAALDGDLTVRVDAVPFTGYVNRGGCGPHSFADRIDRAVAAADGTLVIQGGLNDVFAGREALRRATERVLDAAAGVPRVIVVGPMDVPGREGEAAVDAVLAAEARERGLAYVSALEWDLPVGADRIHLTADGHRAYAERILAALRG